MHRGHHNLLFTEAKLDLSTIFISPTGSSDDIGLGVVMVFLLLDLVFYLFLAIYLDNLSPGPYGVAKSWNYPVKVRIQTIKIK